MSTLALILPCITDVSTTCIFLHIFMNTLHLLTSSIDGYHNVHDSDKKGGFVVLNKIVPPTSHL